MFCMNFINKIPLFILIFRPIVFFFLNIFFEFVEEMGRD